MALYDRIEHEFSTDEPWSTKSSPRYDHEIRDIWEVKTPDRSKDSTFHVLHWSYRSLSKFRYLRYFAR